MGMYTLFHASFSLKNDTPVEIKNAILKMADQQPIDMTVLAYHHFFDCERLNQLFHCSSAYFDEPQYCFVETGHEYGDPEHLTVRVCSSLKNYGGEIRQFVDWIKPFIDMKYGPIIYSRYEESDTNIDHLKE